MAITTSVCASFHSTRPIRRHTFPACAYCFILRFRFAVAFPARARHFIPRVCRWRRRRLPMTIFLGQLTGEEVTRIGRVE